MANNANNGRNGSFNWRANEVEILLSELETSIPIGQYEWEAALGRVNELLDPTRNRDLNAIRNKFKAL